MENFSEDRIIKDRLDKLNKLNELNIDPYPNRWIAKREKISNLISSFIDNETKKIVNYKFVKEEDIFKYLDMGYVHPCDR